MNILRVGDPHAKIGGIPELKDLILFIVEQVKYYNVNRIELLGDLFHTHNVIRLEVIEFWVWALDLLSQTCETVVLVGNHDQSGDYNSTFSALSVFALMNKKNLHIIEKPIQLGVFGYVPYTHDHNVFISSALFLADSGCNVLVCHQTIEGSKYESGIYAPDGISAGEWSERFLNIFSGHIHSEQSFANVIYPGTARWDSVVDANRRKGIWLYHHDETGKVLSSRFISTEKVCNPIQSIQWKEGETPPSEWDETVRMSLELIGSSVWVCQQKEKFKGKCSLKTTITDVKKGIIRKTGNSFEHFIKEFFTSTMDKDKLMKYAKEIGIV